jgi:hypothetical protein
MKFLPFLLPLTLFVSCQSWYKTSVDMSKITNKTTYQPFTELNDPIVVNMPVYETLYLWGNENNKFKQNRIGDMFVIYDWESDEIYDWVFYGKESFYCLPHIIQVGSNPKYYINSLDSSGTIAKLEADKTSVTLYQTDRRGTFFNYSTPGKYCLRDYARHSDELNKVLFCLNIFDCEKGEYTAADIQIPTDAYGYILTINSSKSGDFYFGNILDGKGQVCKVNCEAGSVEIKEPGINCYKENSTSYKYNIDVIYIKDDDFLFLNKSPLGSAPYIGNKLYLYSFAENTKKEFSLSTSGYELFSRIVQVNDNYYLITTDHSSEECSISIYKLNLENMSGEKISQDNSIFISLTQEPLVRGNRIYIFNYWNSHKIQYLYFDVETKEVSPIKVLNQKEVVGFDF